MTKDEIVLKIKEIKHALKAKDYVISYLEASNVSRNTAPDGTVFYLLEPMDSSLTTDRYGSNTIEVAGESFTCELEFGNWSSDFFNVIEDSSYDEEFDAEEYVEQVKELLSDVKEFLVGEYTDFYAQVKAYELMTKRKISNNCYEWTEYFKPISIDDFKPIEDVCHEKLTHNGVQYYLVQTNGNELMVVEADAKPNYRGHYETVLLTVDGDEIRDVSNAGLFYDSTQNEVVEN
ncbi:MAG: hypothetical protein ACI308_08060 [Muribaculaceae bacterium]